MNAVVKRLSQVEELFLKAMHKLVLLLSVLGCNAAMAQTDPATFNAMSFSTPPLQLREWKSEVMQEKPATSDLLSNSFRQEPRPDPAWTNSIATIERLSLSAASTSPNMTRFEREVYARLERGGYLKTPEPPSDNRLQRFLNSTFEPEVLHFGKLSLSCTAITAIKRKNPLCLINAIFLRLEW